MSYQTKHRTRAQKENPHYGNLISWKPQNKLVQNAVKSNLDTVDTMKRYNTKTGTLSEISDTSNLNTKDIFKTLILASLIFLFQAVLYFFLK